MKNAYLILLFSFFSNFILAKELTFNQVLEIAKKNNLDLQQAQQTYNSVVELEASKYSGFLPKLSASMSGNQSGDDDGNFDRSYSARLSLSQNIFAGFSDISSYEIKKRNSKMALATWDSAKSKVSADLLQAYADVYYLQEQKKLAEDILKRRKENYNNVKLQYDVGRENRGSLLLSQTYVESAEFEMVKIENQELLAQEKIKRLLAINDSEAIKVVDKINADKLPENPDFEVLTLNHPDVLNAKNELENSEDTLVQNRAAFLPSLDFSGSYGYTDSKFFPKNDQWNLGLTLTIPLFDGFKDYANYRSQKSKTVYNQINSENILLKTKASIKQAYFSYREALINEKLDKSFNKSAILRAEVARNKYKNGFLNFEEWDLVESDLIGRQRSMIESEKNRITKQSQWQQAQNTGVFND